MEGVEAGELRVRVAAPPVDGAANAALIRLLAHELEVAPSAVRLVSGATGRHKVIAVTGLAATQLMVRWPGLRYHPATGA